MKKIFLSFISFVCVKGYAQCPSDIPLTALPDNCPGTTLTVASTPGVGYNKITWYNGTTVVRVVNASAASGYGATVAGGYGPGPAANQLYPDGIFVDDAGNLFVVDVDNSRVQKWAPGATSGVTVAGGNGAGNAANQLNYPLDLAVDANGDLYIMDASNDRVQKWTPGASSGITVAGGNGQGNAANQFYTPNKMIIDKDGNLYIGDSGNNRVQKWAPGATSGITVAGGNGMGSAANQLYGVYGLALDKEGNLYISDNGNNRVQKWAPGATSGTTVIGQAGYGSAADQLGGPAGLFMGSDDTLYVGDYVNERVMKYAPGSSTGILVAGGNGQGNAPNQFFEPENTFIDNNGFLYVADAFNYRVQRWALSTINRNYTPVTSGIYTAVVETGNGCTITTSPQKVGIPPNVTISTISASVCAGESVQFSAELPGGTSASLYSWKVNGVDAGTNSADFKDLLPGNGDTVVCDVSFVNGCAISRSNQIVVDVHDIPSIDSGQIFVTKAGQGIQLNPVISGNIQSYAWTPGGSLSDSSIRNPIAKPSGNTDYILNVISVDGCKASQKISVQISSDIKIPNAFTPNGDGENDVFNILGGTTGSRIDQFSIYDRWGDLVFEEQNKTPGNNGGWNGNFKGKAAPEGAYVYLIKVSFPDGTKQIYKGTVVLIR